MGFNDESEEVLHSATKPLFALWCIVLQVQTLFALNHIAVWYMDQMQWLKVSLMLGNYVANGIDFYIAVYGTGDT